MSDQSSPPESDVRPERPIIEAEQDKLDRLPFVQRLGAALVRQDGTPTGAVVGLVGEWGSGKSSILNLLDQHLRSRHGKKVVIVRFDPWIVSARDDLIANFFTEVIRGLSEHRPKPFVYGHVGHQAVDEAIDAAIDYGAALSPTLDLVKPGVGRAVGILLALFRRLRWKKRSLSLQKSKLKVALSKLGLPIVILVDELDRIEDSEIRLMAQMVRAVADFPEISYVLAYDDKRVVEALGADAGAETKVRNDRGRAYLEKIVQLQLRLPVIFPDQIQDALAADVQAILAALTLGPDTTRHRRFKPLLNIVLPAQIISNLRDLQRVVASFGVYLSMVGGDVDWVDVLAFSIIEAKAPGVIAALKQYDRYNAVVFDGRHPGNLWEQILEEKSEKLDAYYENIVPDENRSRWMRSLFEFLFPALSGERDADHCHSDEIAFYRPLVTLLRKSVLPGAASRGEVQTFLEKTTLSQELELATRYESNSFNALLDRIDDVYADVEIDDREFWVVLGRFFERRRPLDNSELLRLRSLLRSAADMFRRQTRRSSRFGVAAGDVLAGMIKSELTALPCLMLRSMYFDLGLYGKERRGDGTAAIGPELVTRLSERLGDLLVKKLLEPDAFVALYEITPIYLLHETKRWTDEMRANLNRQLRAETAAFDHFIALLLGGHYAAEREGIEIFMDFAEFRQRVESRLSANDGTLSHDGVLSAAYAKAAEV